MGGVIEQAQACSSLRRNLQDVAQSIAQINFRQFSGIPHFL
jgi:hypothetical protein